MKEAPPQSTENRRRHFGKGRWWLLALFLAACAYQAWREYDFRAAAREAEEAGFQWENKGPWDLIHIDWHYALKKKTWSSYRRFLGLGKDGSFTQHRNLIHRLRPTELSTWSCEDENLDAIKWVTSLRLLHMDRCPNLRNLDALSGLTGLQTLDLSGCTQLRNVDGLRGLTGLQNLKLIFCTELQDVDALKNLTGLQELDLRGCDKIPTKSLSELGAALPNTDIRFPIESENLPR